MKSTKTMTCKQLGGPCDFELRGTTADRVIKAQDQHLKDAVAHGDATHEQALKEMKGRWKFPISGMGWYRQVKRDFAALPETEPETAPETAPQTKPETALETVLETEPEAE
jgi:predicted small metal-binding protein